jgi:fucose permease
VTDQVASTLPSRAVLLPSYASFFLIGWTGLFVPTLLRVLQDDFERSDAEFGVGYLVMALLFAVGALSSGLIAQRVGRRVVLPASALLITGGMGLEAIAPTWAVFLAGAGLAGAGCGAIDAVASSVIMDLSVAGSGNSLNMLHLFYSVGALTAPLAIGLLVALGVDWRAMALVTSLAGLALVVPLARVGTVPPRPRSTVGSAPAVRAAAVATGLRLALAALCVAIACYVASEAGISSWLVGFLDDQPMTVATLGLALFWGGLAAGRLIASRIADRFEPVRFTVACAVAGGIAILAAVALPSGAARIGIFLVAGFAFGPIYPMIMSVAGALFPHRAAAVAGILTAAGVVGSITYPPLMGLIAGAASLAAGMFGAALLIFASGGAVVVAGRLAGDHAPAPREPEPVEVPGTG